jgi:cytochrome oxidase Cu insertion factor (SCO1/SenC/PrrC family)
MNRPVQLRRSDSSWSAVEARSDQRERPIKRTRAAGRLGRTALALLAVFKAATLVSASTLLPPDAATTIGHRIPLDGFVDENGRAFAPQQAERDARPWIISPMYTRCPGTCSAITTGLRRALDRSRLAAAEYRVLSFSVDPNETDARLREFRARMQLPADWVLLRAGAPEALERTLRSLDFRTITMEDGNFEHPNLVAVLAPDQQLVGYLFGTNFNAADLASTLRRAQAGVSTADAWRPYAFALAALGFVASGLVFAWLLSERRGPSGLRPRSPELHRASRKGSKPEPRDREGHRGGVADDGAG